MALRPCPLCHFASRFPASPPSGLSQIFARRNDTAFSATVMDDADIRSADTSGRSDQPRELQNTPDATLTPWAVLSPPCQDLASTSAPT